MGGTPYVDTAAGVVYVVSTGVAHALSLADGSDLPGWPTKRFFEPVDHNVRADALQRAAALLTPRGGLDLPNQYGALALDGDLLYVPLGGRAGR